jgi:diguanylate cyclase (GGDEF)-like protein
MLLLGRPADGAPALPHPAPLPAAVDAWLAGAQAAVLRYTTADEVMADALRGRPELAVLDARGDALPGVLAACERLKRDAFTAILPLAAIADDVAAVTRLLAAGADEALTAAAPAEEWRARLDAVVRRAARDQFVHPTTRLPGTPAIEAELARRLAAGDAFAACYADLDHFKEYNDRYGYTEGDRIIRMVALLLHDAAVGHTGERGFVGHIGGDDFFCVLPLDAAAAVCDTVVETFDALVPYQYSETDRRAGYYFGKDRRGQLHRVPLMTLSIGVVTTERRRLVHAAQVSRLASEMKAYAKGQPGSLWAVDRRTDD